MCAAPNATDVHGPEAQEIRRELLEQFLTKLLVLAVDLTKVRELHPLLTVSLTELLRDVNHADLLTKLTLLVLLEAPNQTVPREDYRGCRENLTEWVSDETTCEGGRCLADVDCQASARERPPICTFSDGICGPPARCPGANSDPGHLDHDDGHGHFLGLALCPNLDHGPDH